MHYARDYEYCKIKKIFLAFFFSLNIQKNACNGTNASPLVAAKFSSSLIATRIYVLNRLRIFNANLYIPIHSAHALREIVLFFSFLFFNSWQQLHRGRNENRLDKSLNGIYVYAQARRRVWQNRFFFFCKSAFMQISYTREWKEKCIAADESH